MCHMSDVTIIPKKITELTAELSLQIVALINKGTMPDVIATDLNLDVEVMKEFFQQQRNDRLIRKAEKNSEEVLDIDLNAPGIEKKYGKNKLQLMKIIQAESTFIRESLGKDIGYSKRTEMTGPRGEAIQIKEILFHAPVPNKPLEKTHD